MTRTPNSYPVTVTSVSTSTTSASLISGPATNGRFIFNNAAAVLYIRFGTTAASSSDFSVAVPSQGYYELPQPLYGGQITAALATGTGSAQVTSY